MGKTVHQKEISMNHVDIASAPIRDGGEAPVTESANTVVDCSNRQQPCERCSPAAGWLAKTDIKNCDRSGNNYGQVCEAVLGVIGHAGVLTSAQSQERELHGEVQVPWDQETLGLSFQMGAGERHVGLEQAYLKCAPEDVLHTSRYKLVSSTRCTASTTRQYIEVSFTLSFTSSRHT